MKWPSAACTLLLVSFISSCGKSDPQPQPQPQPQRQQPVAATCACDQFPFPNACDSKCETGQVQIESVNAKDHTAMILIRHGAQTESQTISLQSLPAGVPAERGASFTALLKKEVNATSALAPHATGAAAPAAVPPPSKIVRFTKIP